MSRFLLKLKNSFKSKTMHFGYLVMLLGVAQTIIPETRLSPTHQAEILLVIGSVIWILRWVTKDDLADKS